jgi:hypothetical protein
MPGTTKKRHTLKGVFDESSVEDHEGVDHLPKIPPGTGWTEVTSGVTVDRGDFEFVRVDFSVGFDSDAEGAIDCATLCAMELRRRQEASVRREDVVPGALVKPDGPVWMRYGVKFGTTMKAGKKFEFRRIDIDLSNRTMLVASVDDMEAAFEAVIDDAKSAWTAAKKAERS